MNQKQELRDSLDKADAVLYHTQMNPATVEVGIRHSDLQSLRDRIQEMANQISIEEPETDPLVEALAGYAHDAWARAVNRIFILSDRNKDGSVTIDPEHAERWHRKMNTHYDDLSEAEKQAERAEARKMLDIITATENPAK